MKNGSLTKSLIQSHMVSFFKTKHQNSSRSNLFLCIYCFFVVVAVVLF